MASLVPGPSVDYFLWGWVKNRVYSPALGTLEDLKANKVREIDRSPFSMLQHVINNVIKHTQACIQGAGDQFEHLLLYFLQYIFTIKGVFTGILTRCTPAFLLATLV